VERRKQNRCRASHAAAEFQQAPPPKILHRRVTVGELSVRRRDQLKFAV
jgi:hypothetical protein